MLKYLVTGGAGFIGSHLVDKLLESGAGVVVLDDFNDFYDPNIKRRNIKEHLSNPNYTLCEGDIRDIDLLQQIFSEHSFDAVIHLAARAGVRPSLEEPVLYQEVNVAGTQNIFECCRKYGVKKCVSASSSSVYGINSKVPFAEDDPIFHPISPYAATKAAGELLAHVYSHLYDIQILCLRFFTVYGPRQRPDLAINKFVSLIDNGQTIKMYGDGSTRRDYTYIDDIIDGILRAIAYNGSKYEVINLGNSDTVYLRDLIHHIEAALGKEAKIKQLPEQPGDVPQTYADISKPKRLLGYNPKTTIKTGIEQYVTWYKKNSSGM